MTQLRYRIKNALGEVDAIVSTLKSEARGVLDDSATVRFEICATEAITNIVNHARPAPHEAAIDIALLRSVDAVTLEIYDPKGAQPFDIRDHGTDLDAVDPLAENGRGIGLILQCADAVTYGQTESGTRLSLTFKTDQETDQ